MAAICAIIIIVSPFSLRVKSDCGRRSTAHRPTSVKRPNAAVLLDRAPGRAGPVTGRPLRVILWWRTGFFSARSRRIVLNRILSHPWKINPSGAFFRPFRGFLTGSEWLSPVRCSGGDVHRRRYLTPWTCPRKIRSHDVARLLFPLRFYNEARYPQRRTGRPFHDTHCAGASERSRRPGIPPGKLTAGRGGRSGHLHSNSNMQNIHIS